MPSRSRRSKSRSRKTKSRSGKRSKRKSLSMACRGTRKYYTKKQCRSYLSRKIRANMHELAKGRWTSRGQAIAVSFSQTQKKYPGCNRFLKR